MRVDDDESGEKQQRMRRLRDQLKVRLSYNKEDQPLIYNREKGEREGKKGYDERGRLKSSEEG